MSKTLPPCADFIIAAIRSIRMTPGNMKPDVAAAVSFHRLYDVTMQAYAKEDFAAALRELLKTAAVVIVANEETWERTAGQERQKYLGGGIRLLADVPSLDHVSKGVWYFNPTRDSLINIAELKEGKFRLLRRVMVYVNADGLPDKIKRVVRRKKSRALEIIEAMGNTG